jgi:UDP-3-O-[3-hydroxymyristoyl] glucosamine N-acyltransferase
VETTVAQIVELVGGELIAGAEDRVLSGFEALDKSSESDLSFFGNPKYGEQFGKTTAGAVLVPQQLPESPRPVGPALIEVENPVLAFDIVVRRFGAPEIPFQTGVHPTAVIAADVQFDPAKVCIEPYAVISSGVQIGDGSWIGSHSKVAQGVKLGESTRLYSHVSIREGSVLGDRVILHSSCVIGSDGFGYEFAEGRHQKIQQAGIVEIGNDVEIGAGTTIDRARFGSTAIGEGTKIDNLVQIGHNVRIGRHCVIVALTGIAGSTTIGDYVVFGAQSGVAGHLTIASQNQFAGRVGVIKDVETTGGTYFGYPAKPIKEWSRGQMLQKKIPTLLKKIADLEKRLKDLES